MNKIHHIAQRDMKDNKSNEITVRCLQCGLEFKPSDYDGAFCPECRLAEILLKDDMPSPDNLG